MSATVTGLIGGAVVLNSDYYFSMYLQNSYTATLLPAFVNVLWDTVQDSSPYVSYAPLTGVITLNNAGRYAIFLSVFLPTTNSNGNASCSTKLLINGVASGTGATYKTAGSYSNAGNFQASYDSEILVTAGTTLEWTWSVAGLTTPYTVTFPGGIGNGYFSAIAYKGLS
jgi:hypothetical protein